MAPRYDSIKLGNLIKDYVVYNSTKAASMISNQIIEGDELIDALDAAKLDLEDTSNYKKLKENLEALIKGKEGIFIDKIKNILQEYKLE
jgi:hypothetical protein